MTEIARSGAIRFSSVQLRRDWRGGGQNRHINEHRWRLLNAMLNR
jgi:hypothetical protein